MSSHDHDDACQMARELENVDYPEKGVVDIEGVPMGFRVFPELEEFISVTVEISFCDFRHRDHLNLSPIENDGWGRMEPLSMEDANAQIAKIAAEAFAKLKGTVEQYQKLHGKV